MAEFSSPFDLTGHVALVTGATGWIGRPMAESLAQAGAKVWLVARTEPDLVEVATKISDRNGLVDWIAADVTDSDKVADLVKRVNDKDGHLTTLVNNAHPGLPAWFTNGEALDQDSDYFLAPRAYWQVCQAFKPILEESALRGFSASVVNLGSIYAHVSPYPHVYRRSNWPSNPDSYALAKAAILQLTRRLAVEWAPLGIRVNSISPGTFPQRDIPARSPAFISELEKKIPMGRIGARDEVAPGVVFLASRGASYVTGSDLAIDGGWRAW